MPHQYCFLSFVFHLSPAFEVFLYQGETPSNHPSSPTHKDSLRKQLSGWHHTTQRLDRFPPHFQQQAGWWNQARSYVKMLLFFTVKWLQFKTLLLSLEWRIVDLCTIPLISCPKSIWEIIEEVQWCTSVVDESGKQVQNLDWIPVCSVPEKPPVGSHRPFSELGASRISTPANVHRLVKSRYSGLI